MKVYVGQTRSRRLMQRLDELGFGECTVRGELPPRRPQSGWFYDNAAYTDFVHRRPFNVVRFVRDMWRIEKHGLRPDFIVLPDLVGAGRESLDLSLSWLDGFVSYSAPVYLAVQDDMTFALVAPHVSDLGGIFVGGTLPWKEATGADWVRFAHEHGLRCHIGRAGAAERVRWARAIGADSLDSSLPLWSEANLDRFVRALRGAEQQRRPLRPPKSQATFSSSGR